MQISIHTETSISEIMYSLKMITYGSDSLLPFYAEKEQKG